MASWVRAQFQQTEHGRAAGLLAEIQSGHWGC